jgi:hypothetical protein
MKNGRVRCCEAGDRLVCSVREARTVKCRSSRVIACAISFDQLVIGDNGVWKPWLRRECSSERQHRRDESGELHGDQDLLFPAADKGFGGELGWKDTRLQEARCILRLISSTEDLSTLSRWLRIASSRPRSTSWISPVFLAEMFTVVDRSNHGSTTCRIESDPIILL